MRSCCSGYMSAWVQGSVNMMGMQNKENTQAWIWTKMSE